MVLTSHILAEIQERVDRLAIMEGGLIRATGTVQDLRDLAAPASRCPARRLTVLIAGSVLHIRAPTCLTRLATLGDTMRDLHRAASGSGDRPSTSVGFDLHEPGCRTC